MFAADWQLAWWNRSWAALLGDPSSSPPQLRNFSRDRFPVDDGPAHLTRWPVTEQDSAATDAAVVSDLRRATGRFPHDTRLAELIRSLAAGNERFAELWAAGTVATHREDHKTIGHPSVGPVEVDCDVLTDRRRHRAQDRDDDGSAGQCVQVISLGPASCGRGEVCALATAATGQGE